MRCAICSHAERHAIEAASTNATAAKVAERFGISLRALERHAAHPRATDKGEGRSASTPAPHRHPKRSRATSPAPAPAPDDHDEDPPATSRSAERPKATAERVLAVLDMLEDEAAPVGDRIALAKALVPPLRLLADLTGERSASESSVVASPHFKRLLGVILEALRDHPAARAAVIDALEREQRPKTEAAA